MAFPFMADLGGQSWTFRDAKGDVASVRVYCVFTGGTQVDAAAKCGAVRTALVALTNAAYQGGRGFDVAVGVAQYGASALYQDVEDKANLVWQDAAGGLHHMMIPSPVSGMFLSDSKTVNPAAITALTTAMTVASPDGVYISNRAGIPLINYMGGYRIARRLRRRLNVMVLTPGLTPSIPAE